MASQVGLYVSPVGGNVGIGTTLPLERIHIVGGMKKDYETNYEASLPNLTVDDSWYNIGTFSGSVGAKLELKIIGGRGYDIASEFQCGGVTYIYCSILNNNNITLPNMRGYFSSQGTDPTTRQVKFVQNGSNRTSYSIVASIASYTNHSIFPTVLQGTGAATFTRAFTATTDPGANSATVQAAIPQIFAVGGSVGIGTTNPNSTLHVNGYVQSQVFAFHLVSSADVSYTVNNTLITAFDTFQTNVNATSAISGGVFTCQINGYYSISVNIYSPGAATSWTLRKNATTATNGTEIGGGVGNTSMSSATATVSLTVGETIRIYSKVAQVRVTAPGSTWPASSFSAFLISKA